jgi:hypothetical protein
MTNPIERLNTGVPFNPSPGPADPRRMDDEPRMDANAHEYGKGMNGVNRALHQYTLFLCKDQDMVLCKDQDMVLCKDPDIGPQKTAGKRRESRAQIGTLAGYA